MNNTFNIGNNVEQTQNTFNFEKTKPFYSKHGVMSEWKNITFRKRDNDTFILNVNEKEIKLKRQKIAFFNLFFSKKLYAENPQNEKTEKNIQTIYIAKNLKKDQIDSKCLKLFKQYLLKGVIEEESVTEKTISNLYTLANECELYELSLSCQIFLNSDKTRKSAGNLIQNLHNLITEIENENNQILEINTKQNCRERVINTLSKKTASPEQLSFNVLKHFIEKAPTLYEKIEHFQKKHPEKIKELKECGWIELKKKYGIKMEDPDFDPDKNEMSYTEFRDQINTFVLELVNFIAPQMDIGSISCNIFGTPGFNSDKDITLISADNKVLTTEEMVIVKCLADLITVNIVGELPGTALDTEWYVDRKFLGDFAQSEDAKTELKTLDLLMTIVQAKEVFKNEPAKFEQFKKHEIKGSQGLVKMIKKEFFLQVEAWYRDIELEIAREILFQNKKISKESLLIMSKKSILLEVQKMKSDSDFDKKYYNAKVLSQYPKLLLLGKKCGELELEIEKNRNLNKTVDSSILNNTLDSLIIQHDLLYAIINCRQPEGTMSSSELKTTLDSRFGQKASREEETIIKKLDENIQQTGGLKIKSPRKLHQKQFEILTLAENEKKNKTYARLSCGDLIIAGQERVAQFSHTVLEKYNLITAGKYFLRTAEANYRALERVKNKILNYELFIEKEFIEKLDKLFQKAKKFTFMAQHFEQCKRSVKLNAIAFKKMLSEILKEDFYQNFDKDIEELSQKDEWGGIWQGQVKTVSEKLYEMTNFLYLKKYITKKECELINTQEFIINTKEIDPKEFERLSKIQKVLFARAGHRPLMLNDLHEEAKKITLKYYEFDNQENVKNLSKKLHRFCLKVQNFMIEIGAIKEFSTKFLESNNIQEIWRENK